MRHMLGNTSPNYFERTKRYLMMHPDGGWGSETLSLTAFASPITKTVTKKSHVTSCAVSYEPQQDLHGYDSPWPAGGGVNKLPFIPSVIKAANTAGTWNGDVYTLTGITFTLNSNGTIKVNGTAEATTRLNLCEITLPAGDYASLLADESTGVTMQMRIGGSSGPDLFGTATTTHKETTTTEESADILVRLSIASGATVSNVTLYPMLAYQSTALSVASYLPYSNICPIQGWTWCEVTASGKNLFNKNATDTQNGYTSNKYLNSSGTAVTDTDCNISEYIPVLASTTYTLNPCSGSNVSLCYYDANKGFISGEKYNYTWGTFVSKTITTPSNAAYIRFSIIKSKTDETQLEFGSTASPFAPYHAPSTASVTFPLSYGGTADVVLGSGSEVYDSVTFDGSDDEDIVLWNSQNPDIVRLNYSGIKRPANNQTVANIPKNSLGLTVRSASDIANIVTAYGVGIPWNINTFILRINGVSTVAGYKAFLAQNPLQIIYEKSTYADFTFTPSPLDLQKGDNECWATMEQAQSASLSASPSASLSSPLSIGAPSLTPSAEPQEEAEEVAPEQTEESEQE